MTRSRILAMLAAPALAGVAAIAVSSVAVLVAGESPFTAFEAMWTLIDSTESVIRIVNRAVPYYVAAIAVAIGFKMNLFNIGANGQYLLAALLAAVAGEAVDLPPVIHVSMILAIAVGVGAAWAAVPAVLKAYRGVNEVISTIMLNYVATNLIAYLLAEHFRNPDQPNIRETRVLPESARLPTMSSFLGFDFGPGVLLEMFLPFALVLGIGYYVLLSRSRFGFELRASGENPTAARTAGISPKRMILVAMIMSGAIAGLIGMGPLIASDNLYKFGDQFPTTFGFIGLSLALLGRNHPVGMAAAALIWATIERATQALSFVDIPQEIGTILQGSFLLSAVIAYEIVRRLSEDAETRAASRQLGLRGRITGSQRAAEATP